MVFGSCTTFPLVLAVVLVLVVELFCRPLRGLCGRGLAVSHGLKPVAIELPPFGLRKGPT